MGVAMLTSCECNSSYQTALRQFICCGPTNRPEWELEVQRYIRDLNVQSAKSSNSVERLILTETGKDIIYAFSEFGYLADSKIYSISWLARNYKVKGKGVGTRILDNTIRWIKNDAYMYKGRGTEVITQIDPRNRASIKLFSAFDFTDEGQDNSSPTYHVWHLQFTAQKYDECIQYMPIILD